MTTDDFCFYLQNRLIQTSQTGGQQYNDTSPLLVFPGETDQKIFPGANTLAYYGAASVTKKDFHQ